MDDVNDSMEFRLHQLFHRCACCVAVMLFIMASIAPIGGHDVMKQIKYDSFNQRYSKEIRYRVQPFHSLQYGKQSREQLITNTPSDFITKNDAIRTQTSEAFYKNNNYNNNNNNNNNNEPSNWRIAETKASERSQNAAFYAKDAKIIASNGNRMTNHRFNEGTNESMKSLQQIDFTTRINLDLVPRKHQKYERNHSKGDDYNVAHNNGGTLFKHQLKSNNERGFKKSLPHRKHCIQCRIIPGAPMRGRPTHIRYFECHCNPTGSLGQTCNKHNGQCSCRKNIIGRTCDKCSEGYWNLDSGTGCHSCECNEIGSASFNCSAHTGQCNCKPGVGGPKCDSCLDGFYGFSANGCKRCDTCSNPAYNCDSETGRCVCPPHSKGIDCSQCTSNSYGYTFAKGCKICDCDHGGSIGQSCDLYTGQCVCREGFTGRRCDRCSVGFFQYPRCERCNCDLDGSIPASNASEPISCDESGQCACKSFVNGLKCDACLPSTFGMTRKNPDGCSKCFCFDRSSDCKQSDLSWGIIRAADIRCLSVEYQNIEFVTIQTMNQDNLISYEANLSMVNGLSMIPGTTGNVSIGSSRGFEVPLYFELPKQFLGDRLLSYAGQFKFSIEMQECKTELDKIILEQFPLVRIHSHNYMTLDYYGPEILQASSNVSYNLRFTEVGWRSHSNNVPVTRELFMTALQNITHILVRATTSVAFTRLTLSNISLETAIFLSGSRNNLAIGVELCNCPQQYNGTSCQNPAAGFYRHRAEILGNKKETIEDFIGESVPCQCNGRTDVCDIETGHCQMCGNNTGGPNCDVCADGYYGSPNDYGCEPCPCPTTQRNFAKGCTFHLGRVRCACKPGYDGDLCEYCAKGYYQNSQEFDGGCMDCECHPDGSISTECDIKTGQCMCKDGVTGRRCDKCDQSRSTLRNGDCQVCDNCTLTLLESSDDLGYMIASDTTLIDLNEIPAPWPRLSMFENSTNRLKKKLIDVMSAEERLENYNDLQIDKMNTKSTNVNVKWQKLLTKAHKQSNASEYLKMNLMNFLIEIRSIDDEAQHRINQLNLLGLATHHINIPTALSDSKTMLQHILEFIDNQNGAFRAHQCANSQLEQWSNISAILTSQTEEAEQMKYDVINTKNRIYDLINRSYETTKILSDVNSLRSAGEKGFEKLKHKVKEINLLRNEIRDLQNTSIIPQTDVQINIIEDDHGKIRQDLSNLVRLKAIVQETNAQTSQQISHLRNEWLPIAQKHSNGLVDRAKEYVQLFQDTKHSAEAAMLASTVYKNITESTLMARKLAIEAAKAAANSENELYPKNSDSIIEKSNKSLKKSHRIHQNALREIKKTEDLEFTLNTQKRKVDSIKNSIWQTGLRNNNISLALNTFSKNDTQEFLRRTIDQANKVSDQMRDVRRGAVDVMTSDVYKLKFKLNSLEPQWAVKFGRAAENVSQSLRNIKNIKNTLSTIETLSARNDEKFRKWNQTMSSSMQELKDKITKARHIAEGIRVSMESKAKCIRSYSPSSFGLYTSNTIKFTIALKSKSITSSILFLQGEDNRFLAIEMVNRKIRFAWNVGGDTISVTHSLELHKKNLEYDDAWYQIEVNRTMNVGSLTVRQMGIDSNKPAVTVTSASQPEFTRIMFSPANRLWVGGVPNDLKPAGLIAHDAGLNVILSNIYVDGQQLGLWNFMHTEGECDGAMFGAREITTNNNIRHFNGQGYSVVKKERSKPYKKNFFALQFLVKTFDENALLFMAVDEKNKRSISLTLHGGRIVYRIDYGNDIRLEINTTKKYNTGQWISIEVAREFTSKRSTENGSLKVNNEEPLTGSPTTPIQSSLLPDFSRSAFYLGGVPPGYKYVNSKAPGTYNAFLGCMKDIQINGETYDPLETSNRYGVEASCKEVISKAGFNGNGYLELPNHSLRKRANVGFAFRTLQPNTLLLFADVPQSEIADNYFDDKDLRSNYSFYLTNGRLVFWADAGRGQAEMMSNNTVNDGEYHTVNVLKIGRKFELRIDDEFQMSKSLTTHPFVINMIEDAGGLYVGGVPDGVDIQGLKAKLNRFHGTMKDFVINNQTISLSNVVNFTNVNIGHEGPQMGSGHHFSELLMKTEPAEKNTVVVHEGCHRFGAYSYEPNAFKFGDAAQSYAIVSAAKSLWQNDFEVQFDFRTHYPNGLLFVVPGTKEKKKHFFTLVLRNGQINVIARSRKRIESTMPRKLNNGQWHRVSLKCINKQLTIRVQSEDENSSVDVEVMKMPRRISVSNVMYVGGMIDNTLSFELTAKLEQFKGCIRRFILNNTPQDLARPGRNVGIGQCFPNVEKGSYFAGDAYATYKRIFQVGKYLELGFEFRTSELNGVILSVSEPNGFPALSIELHKGKIVMSCDLGDGIPFRIESNLSKFALCDNKWHNISAIYDSNQIAIRVDDLPMVNKLKQHEVLSKVNTKTPLYIGGIPETAASGTLLSRENFKGCIRNVIIMNELKDWTDMDDLQNVLLSECLTESNIS